MHKFTFTYKDIYLFFLIIYLLCLPLNAMNVGAFGSALKILAIVPVGVAVLSGSTLRFCSALQAQLLFTIFAFFSLLWTVTLDDSIGRVVTYVLLFALLLSGAFFRYSARDIQKIKSALAWSSRFTAVVMLVFSEYIEGRFWLKGPLTEDPNYICAYFAFGVIYALGVITDKAKLGRKLLAGGELLVYFYLILISGSRGGLLAVLFGAIVYLFTYGEKKQKHLLTKLVLLVVVAVAVIVMIDFLPEELRLRFTVDNVAESGGSGRTELWKQAIDMFLNANIFRQLFGFGTASVRWCFAYFNYPRVNVVHNMFFETLAELGVIGLCLYMAAIYSFVKTAFKFRDKFSLAVIFSMIVMSLSTSIYAFKPYFNIMLFIIMTNSQSVCVDDAQTIPGKLQ